MLPTGLTLFDSVSVIFDPRGRNKGGYIGSRVGLSQNGRTNV